MIATPGLTFPTMQLNSFLSSDPRCLLSAHLFHTQHFWCVSQASCFSVSITSWANLEDVIRVISAPSGTAEDFKHQLSQAQYPYIPFLCQLKWNHEQHSSKPDFARRLALSSSSPRAPWPSADLHQSHRAAPQSTSHVSLVSVSRPGMSHVQHTIRSTSRILFAQRATWGHRPRRVKPKTGNAPLKHLSYDGARLPSFISYINLMKPLGFLHSVESSRRRTHKVAQPHELISDASDAVTSHLFISSWRA